MTVPYSYDISTATFWQQWRVFFHWKGSLWKSVLYELLVWIGTYAILSCCYRFWLSTEQQKTFSSVVAICYKLNDRIPLTFMLGFYVSNVASRWWTVIMNIGFTDNLMMMAQSYVSEVDESSSALKRAIARYMCLTQVLVYRKCSKPVAKLYPTKESLIAAGYLEPSESDAILDEVFWIPLSWTLSLVIEAKEKGLIASDRAVQQIFKACNEFYASQLTLTVYNWLPVPLGYTQVLRSYSNSARSVSNFYATAFLLSRTLPSSLLRPSEAMLFGSFYKFICAFIACFPFPFYDNVRLNNQERKET